jgi:hypothetical protein
MDFAKLKEPFAASDIEWRVGRAGKNAKGVWAMCLAYITNRAIMERLDEVAGPERWRNEYREAPAGGVLCGISIRVGDEWVTKWDGAENTDLEAVKGGLSGAMKRAAVQWGIGRYLYDLPEGWATISDDGRYYGKTKDGDAFHWDPPALPDWALPSGTGKPPAEQVDKKTGEVPDRAPANRSTPTATDDMIDCPKCGGPLWDNRGRKKSPKAPDLKCKDKDGCDHAIWLVSWKDDLLREMAHAHEAGLIDAAQRDAAEEIAKTMNPAKLLALGKRLDQMVQTGILGG